MFHGYWLLAIALPGFLQGPLISMAMPFITGAVVAPIYQAIKKNAPKLDALPAWSHQTINFLIQGGLTMGLAHLGVSLTDTDQACVAAAATAGAAASCVSQGSIETIVRWAIAYFMGHTVHSGISSDAEQKTTGDQNPPKTAA